MSKWVGVVGQVGGCGWASSWVWLGKWVGVVGQVGG